MPVFVCQICSQGSEIPMNEIPGVSQDSLSQIIQYAYTESALITEENVTELLVAADQFLVSGLVDACSGSEDFL